MKDKDRIATHRNLSTSHRPYCILIPVIWITKETNELKVTCNVCFITKLRMCVSIKKSSRMLHVTFSAVAQFWAPEFSGKWLYMGSGNAGFLQVRSRMTFQWNEVREHGVKPFLRTINKICNLKSFTVDTLICTTQRMTLREKKETLLSTCSKNEYLKQRRLVILDDVMCVLCFYVCKGPIFEA